MAKMLVRLKDFAELNRISERTVQIHIKENWEQLEGHVDRKGKQGTWLDDFAQEFLLDCIQLPSKEAVRVPTPTEANLLIQIAEAHKALAEAERRAAIYAEAAGKVALLEEAKEAQEARIVELAAEKGKAEEQAREERERREAAEAELAALKGRNWLDRLFRKGE